ncbi:MAG: NACHT domain-containing protein [Ktedonobacteraceae bacterium]
MIFHAGIVFASLDVAPLIGVLGVVTALVSALTALSLLLYQHPFHTSSDQTGQKKAISPLQYKTSVDSSSDKPIEKLTRPTQPVKPRPEKNSKAESPSTKQQLQHAPHDNDKILAEVQRTRRIDDYVDNYRREVLTDPVMTELKILTMTWRLNLMRVYVRLRLHQGNIPDNIDLVRLKAEETRDPNVLLRADREWLERQSNEAIDPIDAIARYKHCIILGDPGAGKTTLLKYLALRCANKELVGLSNLPIHIDLHLFVHSGPFRDHYASSATSEEKQACPSPLLTFAATEWEKRYEFPREEALAYMQSNLETGNALLLLDGLDETFIGEDLEAAEETYERTLTIIRQLANIYSSAFIVITARTAGYRQRFPLQNFAELEVLDFRTQDIEQFLRNWFMYPPENNPHSQPLSSSEEVSPGSIPPQLKAQLERPRIQALASKPLLLALIIITYQKEKVLPDRRSDLYEACVNTLFAWNDDISRQPTPTHFRQYDAGSKKNLLKKIAWDFHEKGQRYFSRDDLLAVIKKYLKTRPDMNQGTAIESEILDEITLANGLLKEQAMGWYSFLHLTLQEYFTALEAKEDARKYNELLKHLEDPWWEEVILLYAGSTTDASFLLEKLWDRGGYPHPPKPDSYFHTNLILAGQCLAMRPAMSNDTLREDIKQRIIQELKDTPYQLTRRQLAETLIELADEKTGLFPNHNYYIQGRPQRGNTATGFVKDRIIAMLSREIETSRAVQISLVRASGLFQHTDITQTLLDLLPDESIDIEVRMAMAQTLSISGTSAMAEAMVGILSRSIIDLDVRLSIADALSNLIDDTFVPELIKLASNARVDTGLRCAIVDTLGTAGRRLAIPGLREVRDKEKPGSPVHWHCAIALAKLGEFEYLDEVFSLLAGEHSSPGGRHNIVSIEVPRSIVIALGSLRLSSLVPTFLSLLGNEQIPWEVRVSVTVALEATNDASPSIIEELMKLLSNEQLDSFVRAAIGNLTGNLLIGSHGDKRYILPLQRLHIDEQEEPQTFRSVKNARCKLGDTSVIPELLCWIENYKTDEIEPAECLNMLDALGTVPGKLTTAQCETLLRLALYERIDGDIQQSIIALLPQLVYEKHDNSFAEWVIAELYGILEKPPFDQRILNKAHKALWAVRRYDRSTHAY